MKKILIFTISIYQSVLSPFFGMNCRFHPTCSMYAKEAVQEKGVFVGLWLMLKRILKCHPFCHGGFDPVT